MTSKTALNVGFSTGYLEEFWAGWPFATRQMGGSELIVTEVACALADAGHTVTVRLPRAMEPREWRGVRWIGLEAPAQRYDILFCSDDFKRRDHAFSTVLIAQRWDPPEHDIFDEMIFMSKTHARLMGYPKFPAIGGGVNLADYQPPDPSRLPRRVIYTSSPDRGGHHAEVIGPNFDYLATYRGKREVVRDALVSYQRTAKVLIHPCDPVRPSEAFCMSVLEALAAGTPCVISDADALPELWGEVATVLPRPIRYSAWLNEIETLIRDRDRWQSQSERGRALARDYSWPAVAAKYLEVARRA